MSIKLKIPDMYTVMAIVSSLVGGGSVLRYAWRTWVLYRQQDRRPLGGGRWQFDMFQWLFGLCAIGVALELIFGRVHQGRKLAPTY